MSGRFNLNDYKTVAERITEFWRVYPNGRILTSIHEYAENHAVVRAEVYTDREDPRPAASDYAEEVRADRGVNSTSMLENCATSAIGRALANLGMSLSKNRPSPEEMAKAARADDDATPARPGPHRGDAAPHPSPAAAPARSRQAGAGGPPPADDEPAEDWTWTEAWPYLRARGYSKPEQVAEALGKRTLTGLSAYAVCAAIRDLTQVTA